MGLTLPIIMSIVNVLVLTVILSMVIMVII
jgi:hypothetical protein